MKIVIISPYQFRLQRGIERFVYSLANNMAKEGHYIVVYSWSKQNAAWGEWHDKVTIRTTPSFKYYTAKWAPFFYRFWLKKDNPDSVLLNFLYHGEAQLPGNLNYCYVLNSPASLIPNRYDYIQSQLSRFPNMQFVAVSEMVKREALPYINGARIIVIPNGVDASLFIPRETEGNNDTVRLISVAALEKRKGLQYVVQALKFKDKLNGKKIEYHIYGEGRFKDELNEIIQNEQMDRNVFVHEPMNDVYNILPKFDIFLLLSKGEAFALAPIEALACGLPIITSQYDPYPEFVETSFGFMVDRENAGEVHEKIGEILHNYDSMSANARKKSIEYDWSSIASKYLDTFSKRS